MVKHTMPGNNKMYSTALTGLALGTLTTCVFFSSLSFAADARQLKLFTINCVQCHANPESSAPLVGVSEDWNAVIEQGEELTLKNVVLGVGGMPPLGYCSACSEEDLRTLTRLIAGFPVKGVE